jgi:hypothetical protein
MIALHGDHFFSSRASIGQRRLIDASIGQFPLAGLAHAMLQWHAALYPCAVCCSQAYDSIQDLTHGLAVIVAQFSDINFNYNEWVYAKDAVMMYYNQTLGMTRPGVRFLPRRPKAGFFFFLVHRLSMAVNEEYSAVV